LTDPVEIVGRGYDVIAERYLEWSSADDWPARRTYLEYVLRKLADGSSVLELGCGAGVPVTKELSERHQVTAVDISRRQLELARKNAPAATFVHGDMASLHLAPASFDAVVAVHSVTHLPRERHGELFERIHGWLRPGGLFMASLGAEDEPGATEDDWLGAPMFFSHYDAGTSRGLLREAGFELEVDEIVSQLEHGRDCRFLWIVARNT
jgi:cyclopropane fatty-acyl-phospholipid synthase-like methyltransferase